MKLVYVHSETFPSQSAGTVFALNTAAAIAQVSGACHLLVPAGDRKKARAFIADNAIARTEGLTLETLYGLDRQKGIFRFSWRGIFYRNVIGRVRQLAKEGKADAVVTRDLRLAEFYLGAENLPPLIYEAHNFYGDIEGKWPEGLLVEKEKVERERKLAAIEAKIVKSCAGMVFVTGAMQRVFGEFYGYDGPGAVAPSGHVVPSELPAPDRRLRTVAYVGQLHEHKGVGVLLEAVSRLADVNALVIGGDAYLKETRELAGRLGIAERTTFTGFVPPSAIPGHLKSASIGAVPLRDCFYNRYLTSPMKAFDYVAAGLPVVAPRLETLTDIFVEGKGALLYEPDDVDDLAEKIRLLLDDAETYESLVLSLPELLAEFHWNNRAEKIAGLAGRLT